MTKSRSQPLTPLRGLSLSMVPRVEVYVLREASRMARVNWGVD